MSKLMKVNGLDFLLMAQSGVLKVDTDEHGNIVGVDLEDGTVNKFDGLLVALHEFTQLSIENNYTLIIKEQNIPQVPQCDVQAIADETLEENQKNIEE